MQPSMKAFLIILLSLALSARAQDPNWSPSANGLRGRLHVLPPETDKVPFYRIELELENTRDVTGQLKIRKPRGGLAVWVKAADGQTIKTRSSGAYSGMSPHWEPLLLPMGGVIKYGISFPGANYRPGARVGIIDLGPVFVFEVPMDGKAYFLAGRFSNSAQPGDHPSTDWSGTLELPPTPVPILK